jgi:DegV family protein with EDD domain
MVRIVTDSTCDISLKELAHLGVEMLPLTITFGDKSYKDGIELSHEKFYELLEQHDELPKTSQVNPAMFEPVYRRAVEAGDEVVSIHLSKDFSGTLQSAAIAAYMVDKDKIFCVDGCSASFGFALVVRAAVKMRDEGMCARDIAEKCASLAKRSRIIGSVATLKYLKLGGRLSGGAAAIGGVLGIRPVIEVHQGKATNVGKCRGEKAALEIMRKYLEKYPPDYQWGFEFGHANAFKHLLKTIEYFRNAEPEIMKAQCYISGLGPVVGTYVGPGMTAIGYIGAE